MHQNLQQALLTEICVHYRRDVPERYTLEVEPDPGGGVRVRRAGPMTGETECRWLPDVPMPSAPLAEPLMGIVLEMFFGSPDAGPLIVGAPDWTRVVLDVQARRNGWPERLLRLELALSAPGCGTLTRQDAALPATTLQVRVGSEDADALYALPRVVLAGEAARRAMPMRQRRGEVARLQRPGAARLAGEDMPVGLPHPLDGLRPLELREPA